MQRMRRLAVLAVIVIFCVGCDQATKSVAQTQLAGEPPIILADNLVRFEYTENPAAFMSFGVTLHPDVQYWLFTVLASVLLAGVLLFILKESKTMHFSILIALSLFVGGGLGNLIDRFFNDGRVVDFVSIGIGSLRTGIFNVADMAIMTGFVLMILFGRHLTSEEEQST
ncbi:MAG: signal peptidase II [Chloroflexota bacterium]